MKFVMKVSIGLAVLAVGVVLYYFLSLATVSADFARFDAWLELSVSEMKIWQLLLMLFAIAALFSD